MLGGQRLAAGDHLVQGRAVFSFELFQEGQALLDLLQPSGGRVDVV